eukprot:TRINITY_DN14720_c0_g1_i1.p1 TRINITY_DN14720_c0_g1~~TRINITY_DN14720_c0_g1_i1.p1  ORF type:complete len:261 (+),score=29.71 TRINITY_DN14720_c0_g1_i1:3-785(+)
MSARKEWVEDLEYYPEAGCYVLRTMHDRSIGTQECLRSTSLQPHNQVQNFWDDGFELSHVTWLEDRWWVFAHRPADRKSKIQLIVFDGNYPEQDVADCIAQGKEIMYLHFSNNQWCLVANDDPMPLRGPGALYQEVFTFESFPADFLRDRVWRNEKVVKRIAFSGNLWVVVIGNGEDRNHKQELYIYSSWPGNVLLDIVGAGTTSIHSFHYDPNSKTYYLISERRTQHLNPADKPIINSVSVKISHAAPIERLREMGVSQ